MLPKDSIKLLFQRGEKGLLEYDLDLSAQSRSQVFTADEAARAFPLYMTEFGHFYANPGYYTRRDGKMAALLFYTREGQGVLNWKGQVCSLTPGTAVSEIRIGGETLTVPTTSLRWGSTAPEDNQLAVITAPKGGEAALRAKASSKGQVLKKCQTNRIVLVLSVGKSYARVYCDGLVGYIRNSSLTFYPVGGVKEGGSAPTPGWVSFRGRLNSKNTVNIRQNGKNGSRILTDFIAGTPVMVFSQTDRWAEIDVGGYRAYILNEYLTLDTAPQGE